MIRVAVIGMGPIGAVHARAYQACPQATLVGVCDVIKERAEDASRRFGAPAFYDVREMVAQLGPDLCGVCTGGHEDGGDHYEPTMQALAAGCHVLAETPISNSIAQAEEMVAEAKKRGLAYGINLNHRFSPLAQQAKAWIEQGRLGRLLFMNMSLWRKNPRESSPWFQIKALHPHSIDLMRYFCGDIKAVQCFATKAPRRKIWSTAQFNLQFHNGVVGGLCGSYDIERGHPMERAEVAGTGGRFVIEDMFQELTYYPAGSMEKTVISNTLFGSIREKSFDDSFRKRIEHFVDQLILKTPPDAIDGSGADGLAAQRVLAAAIESIERNEVVEVASSPAGIA